MTCPRSPRVGGCKLRQYDSRVRTVTTAPSTAHFRASAAPAPPEREWTGAQATSTPRAAHLPQPEQPACRSRSSSQLARLPSQLARYPSQLSAAARAHTRDFRAAATSVRVVPTEVPSLYGPGESRLPTLKNLHCPMKHRVPSSRPVATEPLKCDECELNVL